MEEKNAEALSVNGSTLSEKRKISRRDFLKLVGVTSAAVPFALKALEKAFYETLIFGFKNPDVNDKAVSVALEVSKNAPNSENPNFRPMVDIVKEGISSFTERTNKPAYFKKS